MEIDWDDLLDNSSPPRVLEVIPSTPSSHGDDGAESLMFSELSDHDLRTKISRLQNQIETGFSRRLPDGGTKLRCSLKIAEEELDRRRSIPSPMVVDLCEKDAQQDANENPKSSCNSRPNFAPSVSASESYFASRMLEGQTDTAFNKQLAFFKKGDSVSSMQNDRQMHKGRLPTHVLSAPANISSRKQPFQFCADKHKERCSESKNTLLESSSKSLPRKHQNSLLNFPKRRAPEISSAPVSKSKKHVELVHLDEDSLQAAQTMEGDVSDERTEDKIYYPARDHSECVELCYSDLKCLEPQSFLSSPIMNFYIQYIKKSLASTGKLRDTFHIFNTYFYKKLEDAILYKGDMTACYGKLRRWWKGVNLFQKAYILFPVHGDMHWSLVIICFPRKDDEAGPILLHLDSLGIHKSERVLHNVESYIKHEWDFAINNTATNDLPFSERIQKNFPRRITKKRIPVPQQQNEYDCGIFVLYFMERFIREAPDSFNKCSYSMFSDKWFKPKEASELRKRVRDLLLEEFVSAQFEDERKNSPKSSSSNSDCEVDPGICQIREKKLVGALSP